MAVAQAEFVPAAPPALRGLTHGPLFVTPFRPVPPLSAESVCCPCPVCPEAPRPPSPPRPASMRLERNTRFDSQSVSHTAIDAVPSALAAAASWSRPLMTNPDTTVVRVMLVAVNVAAAELPSSVVALSTTSRLLKSLEYPPCSSMPAIKTTSSS